MPISHLLFADDLIIFGEAGENTLLTVQETLDMFMEASVQKVNC